MKDDLYYKNNPDDRIWWKRTPDAVGEFVFSFDKKKDYNLFADYPYHMGEEEVRIFDQENPMWADYFSDRKE